MQTKHLKLTRSDFFQSKDELADYRAVKENLIIDGYQEDNQVIDEYEDTVMYEDETGRVL